MMVIPAYDEVIERWVVVDETTGSTIGYCEDEADAVAVADYCNSGIATTIEREIQ